ncbi:hypothetical protein GE061_003339 [Apolygus lucorum]|uniref:Tudor domain-containing protein n=1 Tax=Apolygus lucorum TaxID=248454 RepID=A0A6A4JK23_APOLU|nr:hypothetical protein GE061_003339 [Apolygus lucorum]
MDPNNFIFNSGVFPPILYNNVSRSFFHPELDSFLHPDSEVDSVAISRYVHPPVARDELTDVVVVGTYGGFFNSPQRIFVIPQMWIEGKKMLVKHMNDHFRDCDEDCEIPDKLISGCNYAVFFKGIWNRVTLKHMIGEDRAKLIFIDEGIIRKIYVDRIKHLPARFLNFGALVVEVKMLQHFIPCLTKGDLITVDFKYQIHTAHWAVSFISGPVKMVNSLDEVVTGWILDSKRMYPVKDREISNMMTLTMAVADYDLPPPGVPIAVVVIRESSGHFMVTPVAWLKELGNMIRGLPLISGACRPLPFSMLCPGTSCAVPYAGGWFRARIRSTDKAAFRMSLKVRLIDLGFLFHVDRYDAHTLPPPLLPTRKKPLCFAIKKTPEISKDLTVRGFSWIVLDRKADDNSWIANSCILDPSGLNIASHPYL